MKPKMPIPKSWGKLSYSCSVETTPLELSLLGEHLGLCKGPSPIFAIHCAAQSMCHFVASRFVTSLLLIAALAGLAALAL